MKWFVLLCVLMCVIPSSAMRGRNFNLLLERHASAGSQEATQTISPSSSNAASELPIESLTQAQKDMRMDLAIFGARSPEIISLLNGGATFYNAVDLAAGYNRPEQLKIILDYDKQQDIFLAHPIEGYSVDPVRRVASHARIHTEYIGILRILLADKRVDPVRYIKQRLANESPQICALFLLAAQGSLTEQDLTQAQFLMLDRAGPVLMNYNKVDELYNVFPADQHASIHEMLIKREGGKAEHLLKAAALGNTYMVSRLLYTAPNGPFEKEDIVVARQAAQLHGHKEVANILQNTNKLGTVLPIKLCTEFQDIVLSTRPKINAFDVYHTQMGVNPELARAKIQTAQKRATLAQAAIAEKQQAKLEHMAQQARRQELEQAALTALQQPILQEAMNIVAPQQALLVRNKRKAKDDESAAARMLHQKLDDGKKK